MTNLSVEDYQILTTQHPTTLYAAMRLGVKPPAIASIYFYIQKTHN